MNKGHTTGLGEPQPIGKKALFPPATENEHSLKPGEEESSIQPVETETAPSRVRTTLALTNHTLAIIQQIQCSHRLRTGKVLPLWKLIGLAIERYKDSTNSKPALHPEPALHEPDGKREV
jgi:hypothetical protein